MRTCIKAFLFITATISASAVPATVAAETTLRANAGLATTRELTQSFLKMFVEPVNRAGKGAVQIKYIGGPEAIPPTKGASALSRGIVDVLHTPAAYYAGTVPEGLAFLISEKPPAELRKNGAFAMLDGIWNRKLNAKLLSWPEAEVMFNLYLSRKPQMLPDGSISLKGFKMRSTPTYRPLLEALGATPVSMKSSEIYTGLQRGVVEGFGSPEIGVVRLGVGGAVKYRVNPSFYRNSTLVLINLDRWKALDNRSKSVLERIAVEYESTSNEFVRKDAKSDEDKLVASGMQSIDLKGNAAKAYLAKAYETMWEHFEKRVGKETADTLRPRLR